MTSKPTEKIIEALTQLLEGYAELQESVAREYGSSGDEDDDRDDTDEGEEELSPEVEAALVVEMKAALEAVVEGEDYTPEEVANFITTLTESLEEIDPTVFDHKEVSADSEGEGGDYQETDDDDIDYDDDDDDYDDDDEDDEDEEDDEDDDD